MAQMPSKTPRWKKWGFRFFFVAVLVAAATLWFRLRPARLLPVKIAVVQRGSIQELVTASAAGDVLPNNTAWVRASLSAPVIRIDKQLGAHVNTGDLIVVQDDVDVRAQLQQAQAAISIAQAQADQATQHVHTLQKQFERVEPLVRGGAGIQQTLDDTRALLQEAQAAQKLSQAQVQQSRMAYLVTKATHAHTQSRAPFAGLLVDLPVHVGESVTINTPLFQIVDDSRLYVELTVDEADAGRVAIKQPATLRLDALPNTSLAGHVSFVDPIVKKDPKGARLLTLRIEIEDPSHARKLGLQAGMSANAEIEVLRKDNVLRIPTSAVIGRGKNRFVYKLISQGKEAHRIQKVPIVPGIVNWEWTEVMLSATEPSLHDGDKVVVSLNEKGIEDGALVRIEEKPVSGATP